MVVLPPVTVDTEGPEVVDIATEVLVVAIVVVVSGVCSSLQIFTFIVCL